MNKILQRITAFAACLMLAAVPGTALAQDSSWAQLLGRYPDRQVEDLTGSLEVTASRSWQEAREELAEQQMTIEVFAAGGEELNLDGSPLPLCTGQHGAFYFEGYEEGVRLFNVIIQGDVRGTGLLNITQLTRMADAITDWDPLTGVYAQAADLTGNGEVDIMDLVVLARWLRDSVRPRSGVPILVVPERTC